MSLFILVVLCVAAASRIALHDHSFVGDDPVLEKALERFIESQSHSPPFSQSRVQFPRPIPTNPMFPTPTRRDGGSHEERPDWHNTYKSTIYIERWTNKYGGGQNPDMRNLIWLELKCIDQSILSVQQRIKEADRRLLSGHKKDKRFRLAHAFHKLDRWKRNVQEMWGFITWAGWYRADHSYWGIHAAWSNHSLPEYKRVNIHIRYYTYFVRRQVDVTLTMDYILGLHDNIQKETENFTTGFTGNRRYGMDYRQYGRNQPRYPPNLPYR